MANCDIIPTTHHFGDDTSQIKCSPGILTLGHQQEIPRLSVSQRQSGWETLRKLWTANYELNPQDIPKWLSKAAWSRNCWVWLFFSFFVLGAFVITGVRQTQSQMHVCPFAKVNMEPIDITTQHLPIEEWPTEWQKDRLVFWHQSEWKTANLPLLWTQSEQTATFLDNKENSWAVLNSTHYQDLHFCGPTGYKLMNHIHHREI